MANFAPYIAKSLLEMNQEFEVQRAHDNSYQFTTLIYDITVRNSAGNSHYIGDIYVRFTCTNNGLITAIQGARHTFSEAEVDVNYVQSHLAGIANCEFRRFCLGTGYLNNFHYNDYFEVNEGNAKMFILLLKDLVSWESLEGVPHRRMSNIGIFGEPYNIDNASKGQFFNISNYNPIDFNISNGRVKISREWIQSQLIPDLVYFEGKYYQARDIAKMRSPEQFENWRRERVREGGILSFKGINHRLTISRANTTIYEVASKLQKVTHPKIIDYYVEHTSSVLENWIFQKIRAKGEISNDNSQKSLGSNYLSLLPNF